ncbi:MAG: hypothetical protein AMS23_06220 [Bacteroides sp. SM1_62]|nr:MAG: hypothetical protein AMS26_06995 [Bacteroides sp. SM23_62]KPL23776.1 MAG: hypothetical protein AMS23_06220 [Bacteroides sp. SM1_62]
MRHTVEQIKKDSRFQLLDKLHYDDILEFATEYVRKRTRSMFFYLALTILFFILQWSAFLYGIFANGMNTVSLLKQFLYGLIISLTIVIPFHELIHALVYLLLGARKIRFGAVLKHFAFYAVADDFVANRNAFIFLALSPFVIVSGLNLAGFIFVHGYASYTYISVLFFHATMCAGDFALLSYFEFHRDKELYTFDDVGKKTSYFYYKKPEASE